MPRLQVKICESIPNTPSQLYKQGYFFVHWYINNKPKMYYFKTFTILLLTVYLFQCKKNREEAVFSKPLDTLKPLRYYPVFPGSFWLYLNEKNDTVKYFTLDNYIKHCFDPGHSDTVFVPYLTHPIYGAKAVYQYDEISEFRPLTYGVPPYKRTPVLSEIENYKFKRGGFDNRYGDHRPFIIVLGKYRIDQDSVLILRGNDYYYNTVFIEHYTKDIGLTLSYTLDSITKDTVSKLRLISYQIKR